MVSEQTKVRIPLAEAEVLAAEVLELVQPWTERAEIAGSIRRRQADVGDIEIVCVPKIGVLQGALFGWGEGEVTNLLHERVTDWLVTDTPLTERRDKNGRVALGDRYLRLCWRGFGFDLFCVLPPAQWGAIFTIRTGPAAYSHRLVTSTRQEGLMPPWLKQKDGALWHGDELVPTPEEADFFRALNLEFVPPEERA